MLLFDREQAITCSRKISTLVHCLYGYFTNGIMKLQLYHNTEHGNGNPKPVMGCSLDAASGERCGKLHVSVSPILQSCVTTWAPESIFLIYIVQRFRSQYFVNPYTGVFESIIVFEPIVKERQNTPHQTLVIQHDIPSYTYSGPVPRTNTAPLHHPPYV